MPASDRVKAVAAFNPAGDIGIRAGAPTTNDNSSLHIIGAINATTNIRRYVSWWSVLDVLGMIQSGAMTRHCTGATATDAKAVFMAITSQVTAITESGTYATVDGSVAWATPGVDTTGIGSSPGHNTGTARCVYNEPTAPGPFTLSGDDFKAVLQEAFDYALANKINVCAFIDFAEDETNVKSQSFTIASREYLEEGRPTLEFDVIPAIYSDLTNHIEVEAIPDSSNKRVSLRLSDWTFIEGDTLTVEHSASSDLSSPTTETPVALHTLSENDWVHFTVPTGRYYRFKASLTAGTPVVCPGAILQANASSTALPEGVIRGVPRVRSETTTLGAVRVASIDAFGEDDVFMVKYGSSAESLNLLSDPFSLVQSAGRGTKATFGPLVAGTRYWWQTVGIVGGNIYEDVVRTFKHVPGDDEMAFLIHSDRHAMSNYLEKIGAKPITGLSAAYCPQTFRQQIIELAALKMLTETGPDGYPLLFQICVGDGWSQTHHGATTTAYPMNADGTPTEDDRVYYVTDQNQANITLNLTTGNDETLADIPAEVEVPGNHRWANSFGYGNSTSVEGKNTITDPAELNGAEWTIDAQAEFMGNPSDSDLYLAGSDPKGRWGGMDRGPMRIVWIDVYLFSVLTSTDPNTIPVTYDSVNDWTIGQLYDWLFNPTTGVLTTCDKPHFLLFAHNWTGGAAGGGPGNYGWGGIKVASPHGEDPTGEWPGAAAWQSADRYGYGGETPGTWQYDLYTYGVHKSIVRRKPAGTQVYLFDGHAHFFCIENGGDGVVYHQIGREVGDDRDTISAGPGSRGHRTQSGGVPRGYSDTLRPGDFWCNNGGYMRVDVTPTTLRLRIRKVWDDFDGQQTANSTDVIPAAFAPGNLHNQGPNAIQQEIATVFDRTYYHPSAPALSFSDSFNRFVEDGTTMEAAGTEQPAPAVGAANQCTTESGAYWKNYSSDDVAFLAVRASVIDAAKVLSTRRPMGAEDPAVMQSIRRMFSGVGRRIRVKIRSEGGSELGIVQIAGGDFDPDTESAVGMGLYLTYDGSQIQGLHFDDGDTIEDLVTDIGGTVNTTFRELDIRVAGKRVTVYYDNAKVAQANLTDAQWATVSDADDGGWVGLAASTNNVTDEGFVFEWQDFSIEQYKETGGRRRSRRRIR